MLIEAIDHIQITSSPDVEDAILFFYSNILGLTEISKPENLKANGGAWYLLGNIQLHISTEKVTNNETSRRHICFRVRDLNTLKRRLEAHGVEIIPDQNPIPGWNRFFIRDPGGNRVELAEVILMNHKHLIVHQVNIEKGVICQSN
ncbi:glyoxalase/bleomycin resistance protein/dioxygenase [Rivularia sp. IAM M-261]|nr:glyoxalase/bleomycin resistance protein/dioxygenase [Rivularia sp. IAM M-261]